MVRLTERDEFGYADIIGVDSADLQLNLNYDELNLVTYALGCLAAYEDTGLSPDEVADLARAKREGRLVAYGKWIEYSPADNQACRRIECGYCGRIVIVATRVSYSDWVQNRNWCELCGAKMDGEAAE